MKSKLILILVMLSLLVVIGIIIFFKNKPKSTELPQVNTVAEQKEEILKKEEILEKEEKINKETNKQFSTIKIKYNEDKFKIFLKSSSHQKIPNTSSWYFASNVLAIDKNYFKNLTKEVLWKDENFYYIANISDKIHNSFDHFNPEYSLVVFDKNNSTVGVVNGYFILSLNANIEDKKYFENQYNVNIISTYSKEKIIVARAKKNTNLVNTFSHLKSNSTIKDLEIEIITDFPKAE